MWSGLAAAGIAAGASLLGGALNKHNANASFDRNLDAQREFAQNGIRWRVADAKAAGLHPLAALGAQTTSYSPQAYDSTDYASMLGNMGQNIGRAIQSKQTPEEREYSNLRLEGARLDNENKRAQVGLTNAQTAKLERDDVFMQAINAERAVNTQQQVPSMPSTSRHGGSGQVAKVGSVEVVPDKVTSTTPDETHTSGKQAPFTFDNIGDRVNVGISQNRETVSEDLHGTISYKGTYLDQVAKGVIKGPPRYMWKPHQTKLIDSGHYHWQFDPLLFSWFIRKNTSPVNKDWAKRVANKFIPGTYR